MERSLLKKLTVSQYKDILRIIRVVSVDSKNRVVSFGDFCNSFKPLFSKSIRSCCAKRRNILNINIRNKVDEFLLLIRMLVENRDRDRDLITFINSFGLHGLFTILEDVILAANQSGRCRRWSRCWRGGWRWSQRRSHSRLRRDGRSCCCFFDWCCCLNLGNLGQYRLLELRRFGCLLIMCDACCSNERD